MCRQTGCDTEPVNSQTIQIGGIRNFRELGGIPLEGGKVRNGCLYRCGRLSDASQADLTELTGRIGLSQIVDFRNSREQLEHPDPVLKGVRSTSAPVFSNGELGIAREDRSKDPLDKFVRLGKDLQHGGAERLLKGLYPQMVSDARNRVQFSRFFRVLLRGEGPVLWHCTSGKDRTGAAAALLLTALGARWDDIMEDYLRTNTQESASREELCRVLAERNVPPDQIREVMVLESVEPDYLNAFRRAAEDACGSLRGFLKSGLGLTEAQLETLARTYTQA